MRKAISEDALMICLLLFSVSMAEGSGINHLVLVNKLNPLPDCWEDALETVHVTNSLGDDVEVEARAYAAYEKLKADLETNDGIYPELDSALAALPPSRKS